MVGTWNGNQLVPAERIFGPDAEPSGTSKSGGRHGTAPHLTPANPIEPHLSWCVVAPRLSSSLNPVCRPGSFRFSSSADSSFLSLDLQHHRGVTNGAEDPPPSLDQELRAGVLAAGRRSGWDSGRLTLAQRCSRLSSPEGTSLSQIPLYMMQLVLFSIMGIVQPRELVRLVVVF